LRQADDIRQFFNLSYRNLKPVGRFRDIRVQFNQLTAFDFEGNYNRIQYELKGFARFNNNWFVDVGYIHKPRIFTNTILQGGPRYRFSQEDINFFFFGTDERKKLRTSFGYVFSAAKQNNFKFFKLEGDITYQPLDALLISIRPEFIKNPSKVQYVTASNVVTGDPIMFDGSPRYIQGAFKNQSLSASVRINYTITPNLTIQYYGQPFVFRARFKDFLVIIKLILMAVCITLMKMLMERLIIVLPILISRLYNFALIWFYVGNTSQGQNSFLYGLRVLQDLQTQLNIYSGI